MLKLFQLMALNFRSIKEETVRLQSLSILIGQNNAGKSNVLDAIAVLLEGTNKDVKPEEFFNRNNDFIIEAKFSNVTEYLDILSSQHRPKIEQCIDGDGIITVHRVGNAAEQTLSPIQILNPSTGTFSTPTGIDAALKQILPEVVHVKPLADVADEVSSKAASSLTKILTEISSEIESRAQPLLDQAYKDANKLLNVIPDPADPTREQDQRIEALIEIEGKVTRYLQETFPGSKVRLKMELPTVKQILGGVDVLIHDRVLWNPYYRQGHGLQRVLLLSMLRALALELRERPENAVRRPFMLLIEEPELFLYPLAQEQMRGALELISTTNQVIYATHSPLLISPDQLSGLVRLHKVPDPDTSLEKTEVIGAPITEEMLEGEKDILAILNLQRSAQLFFSDTVVLVEGEADRHLHRAIFQKLFDTTLELEDIALVEVGGKDRLYRFKNILSNVCPRVFAVADVDYIWEGAGNELGADVDLSQLVQQCRSKAEEELAHDPRMKDLNSDEEAKKLRELMMTCCFTNESCDRRNAVCGKLEELGTFVLSRGNIEVYVDLRKTSKGKYLDAAREIESGERILSFQDELRGIYTRIRGVDR